MRYIKSHAQIKLNKHLLIDKTIFLYKSKVLFGNVYRDGLCP